MNSREQFYSRIIKNNTTFDICIECYDHGVSSLKAIKPWSEDFVHSDSGNFHIYISGVRIGSAWFSRKGEELPPNTTVDSRFQILWFPTGVTDQEVSVESKTYFDHGTFEFVKCE
jgi:hypothetical protein